MIAKPYKLALVQPAAGEVRLATRLLRAVLVKLFAEILFVCAVVSFAAFAYFNPALRGEIEVVNSERVEGWAYNPLATDERLEVQLFIDDRFVAATRADRQHDGLVARAGRQVDHCFSFTLAGQPLSTGRHRAQVYVVHGTPGSSRTLLPITKRGRLFEVKN